MYLDKAKKEEIFNQYGKSATDTGSAESQISLFTFRIIVLGRAFLGDNRLWCVAETAGYVATLQYLTSAYKSFHFHAR